MAGGSASSTRYMTYSEVPGGVLSFHGFAFVPSPLAFATDFAGAGFTAAVSHELRTPLARLLALLETALLPSADVPDLIEQGKAEVEQIRELIDDVLFLSELETGRAVVSLASTRAAPIVRPSS